MRYLFVTLLALSLSTPAVAAHPVRHAAAAVAKATKKVVTAPARAIRHRASHRASR